MLKPMQMAVVAVCALGWSVAAGAAGDSAPRAREGERATIERLRQELLDLELFPPTLNARPGAEYSFDKIDFAMNAGMALTKGGRLYATWFAGGDDATAHMVGTWSDDGGKTWAGTKFVVGQKGPILTVGAAGRQAAKIYRTVLIGNIWAAPDGTLRLYAYHGVNMFSDRGTLWEFVCRDPDADEPVWEEPRFLALGGCHNKPIVLRDGTWLLPNDFETSGKGLYPDLADRYGCGFLASTDRGATWRPRGSVRPEGTSHFAENMAVELGDGTIRQLLRTGLGLMQSESRDGGFTWSKPRKPENLTQVIARFGYLRLANGHLVFVKNGVAPARTNGNRREKLTAFVSDDEGRTWKGGLELDGRDRVSYPDAFQAQDGAIYVSYDHNRWGDKNGRRDELLFAKFTEADILARQIVSEGSSLRNVIFRELDR